MNWKQYLGAFLIFAGIIAIGGSANDCDGHCMEQANTIGEMFMVIIIGLMMCMTGGWLVLSGEK